MVCKMVDSLSMQQFFIVWLATLATMLACRVAPIFILKNQKMPEPLRRALNLIPPAAFAALVANDLFNPALFEQGVVASLVPYVCAAIVLIVARKSQSLIACALTGVISYAALSIGLGLI